MNYYELAVDYAATLAAGLPPNSRIYTKIWHLQKERQKKEKRRSENGEAITKNNEIVFESSDDFKKCWDEIIRS